LLTRGSKPDNININSKWQKGLDFLKLHESEWPITKTYRKDPQISRVFFPKIVAQNRGCGLSAGTFGKGAVNLSELTLYG